MPRPARRARIALRFDRLEPRALLSTGSAIVPADTVLVRFQEGTPAALVQAALGSVQGQVVESFPDGPSVVELGGALNADAALRQLRSESQVLYAEPDATLHAADIVPNDPMFGQLWGLNNANGVGIDAPQAWGITTGNPGTIIAVLDTGIDLRNPEFAGRIWTNPNPRGDVGFPNDLHGWNFMANTPNVQDNYGHGTHVAGILAANGNNGFGITGVNWHAQIMPVKVLDGQGNGTTDAAVGGIYYAVNHGARVINASWGGGDYSQSMLDAIRYADSRGVVFVTAAGNDGTNNDVVASYPASYRLPNEIAVAAVDSAGNLASFSNVGGKTVDLAAPGVDIVSTVPGGYATYSGTSMATPYVSGVVSLLAGIHPEFSAEQLVHQVLATTKPLASLANLTVTGGLVDAYGALTGHRPGVSASGSASGSLLQPGGSSDAAVQAAIASWGQQSDGAFLTQLFQAVLDRAPDPAGFAYYLGQLQRKTARIDVAQAMENTPEARAVQVARWYCDGLGVSTPSLAALEVDPSVMFWSPMLVSYTPNTVLAGILATNTFYASQGGTDAGFITGLFQVELGRAPDPAGLSYYLGQLHQGVSRFDVARALQATVEAKRTKVARWFQEEYGWTQDLNTIKANPGVASWAAWLAD